MIWVKCNYNENYPFIQSVSLWNVNGKTKLFVNIPTTFVPLQLNNKEYLYTNILLYAKQILSSGIVLLSLINFI